MDERTIARFWAKVDKRGTTPAHAAHLGPCWVWTSTRAGKLGHGVFYLQKGTRRVYAHRFSWVLHFGPLTSPCVMHMCDNARCVNPAHLRQGTQTDNMRDCSQKGRLRQTFTAERTRGERNAKAQLSLTSVLAIRAEPSGRGVCARLAQRYGVTQSVISKVRNRTTWAWLTDK